MTYVARVLDASGNQVFADDFVAMRVIGNLQVRDSTYRSAAMVIETPLAGPGVIALVLPLQEAYTDTYNNAAHLGPLPIVTVHDGYVKLAAYDLGRTATQGFSYKYRAMVDIALVKIA